MKTRRLITTIVLCLVIIGKAVGLGFWLFATKNVAEVKEPEKFVTKVRVIKAEKKPFTISVKSNGKIESSKKVKIASEVTGIIKEISDKLEIGETIPKGELIARIDDADFKTALINAKASESTCAAAITDARLTIVQEEARAEQNIKEWRRLGKGEPPELVARVPQLASAKARLLAAEASYLEAGAMVEKAERDLKKANVIALVDIKVDRKFAEVGDFIMPGGLLLEGHSAGALQVRLPITLDDYLLIKDKDKKIDLTAKLGENVLIWKASFLRSEGVVDQSTMTIPIIASIIEDKESSEFSLPPIGLFIDAKVPAQKMEDVIVLPRAAIQLGDKVYIVDEDMKLRIRPVKVVYRDKDFAVVENLELGDVIVISPLEAPVDGMQVELAEEDTFSSSEINIQ